MGEAGRRQEGLVEHEKQLRVRDAERVRRVMKPGGKSAADDEGNGEDPERLPVLPGEGAETPVRRRDQEAQNEDQLPGQRVEKPAPFNGPGRQVEPAEQRVQVKRQRCRQEKPGEARSSSAIAGAAVISTT